MTNALTQVYKKDPQEDRENGGVGPKDSKQKYKMEETKISQSGFTGNRFHRHPGVVEPVRLCPSGHDQQPKGEVLILGCPNSVKLPPPDMINSQRVLLSS